MATEEQQSPEMARQVSRYLGAFVGTAIVVGEGVVGACEKSARAARGLFGRQGATCGESASEDSEPVFEEITPEPAQEVKGEPAVAEAKPKPKPKPKSKSKPKSSS